MKKLIALTTLFALTAGLTAGEGWLTNLDKAKAVAKKEKKMILVEFTGSDWCPPCKALKKTVFNSDTFKKYAKSSLVLVELDFPRGKNLITKEQAAYNRTQAKKFKVSGYPTVILMDANGKQLLKKVGYGRTPVEAYIKMLKNAKFQ